MPDIVLEFSADSVISPPLPRHDRGEKSSFSRWRRLGPNSLDWNDQATGHFSTRRRSRLSPHRLNQILSRLMFQIDRRLTVRLPIFRHRLTKSRNQPIPIAGDCRLSLSLCHQRWLDSSPGISTASLSIQNKLRPCRNCLLGRSDSICEDPLHLRWMQLVTDADNKTKSFYQKNQPRRALKLAFQAFGAQ